MRELAKGVTSYSQYLVLRSSTTGLGLAGKIHSDVTGSYTRNRAARTAITMATLASASAAFSSGGFILVDDANCPGLYRFDIPDAAFATGVDKVIVSIKVTGAIEEHLEFTLTNWNKQVAETPPLPALDSAVLTSGTAAAGAASTITLVSPASTVTNYYTGCFVKIYGGTGAGQTRAITSYSSGRVASVDNAWNTTPDATSQYAVLAFGLVVLQAGTHTGAIVPTVTTVTNGITVASGGIAAASFAAGAIDAAAIATDAIGSAELAASAVTEIQSGLATSAAITTAQTDLDDIQTRLPAALVSGRIDASVGAMAANTLTATAIAADAITAAKVADGTIDAATFAAGAIDAAAIATDAIGSAELAASAVTEIQSGLATSAALATVQADTDDLQARLPTALVSGRIDASVGAMGANTLTATAIATDAITAAKIAADAIGASELAADAVTEIADGLLDRNLATGTDSGTETLRTVRQALRALRNKFSYSGNVRTVTKEDDTTASWTSTSTTSPSAEPIIADDPTG